MNRQRLLIFVDSNILIEGFLFPRHTASAVIVLAANKQIDLVTCNLVVEDVEKELLERATAANDYELVDAWGKFLEEIRLQRLPDPPIKLVKETRAKYLGVMRHLADIPVLASAIEVGPDLILSDNTEHFNVKVSERCGITIWSTEEFVHNMVTGTLKEKLRSAK